MDIFWSYVKLEYSQFGSSVVHKLVYKVQESFRIPFQILQLLPHPCVRTLCYHLLQRVDYESERSSHLV